MIIVKNKNYLLIIILLKLNFILSQENKIFWDGTDWNNISKELNYNETLVFNMKKAYLQR